MSLPTPPTVDIYQKQNVVVAAQLGDPDGGAPLQAEVTAIELNVYDLGDEPTVVSGPTDLTASISSIIFDAFQTDGYWGDDDVGYNFRHEITGTSIFTKGSATYEMVYEITTSTFGTHWVVGRARVHSVTSGD